jgi:hypothetical protein
VLVVLLVTGVLGVLLNPLIDLVIGLMPGAGVVREIF